MLQTMLEVKNLVKRYGSFTAVDDLSFEVHQGEIFGLLGPNGAGKTTTIRMIMDIFKPNEGMVRVTGKPPTEARRVVGYLPEERGLYRDLRVLEVLTFLGELKGTPRAIARTRALQWLEQLELAAWANHRVKDLSRGMQQKVQIIATIIHDPQLLILDEPFSGLDPVNVDTVKGLIHRWQQEGKTVVLSAHQMNLVEVLCDRIVLIHKGKNVLYGPLAEIKRRYAPNTVRIRTPATLTTLPGVTDVQRRDGTLTLTLAEGVQPQAILRQLVEQNTPIESFEVASVPLEDIFIAVVKERQNG